MRILKNLMGKMFGVLLIVAMLMSFIPASGVSADSAGMIKRLGRFTIFLDGDIIDLCEQGSSVFIAMHPDSGEGDFLATGGAQGIDISKNGSNVEVVLGGNSNPIVLTDRGGSDAIMYVGGSGESNQDLIIFTSISLLEAVEKSIDQIPETFTDDDEDLIVAAREAYDRLGDQAAEIDSDRTAKLLAAEAELQTKKDEKAAQDVIDIIEALPDAGSVKLEDEGAIANARAALANLTEDQRKLVTADTIDKLAEVEAALYALKAIEDIPEVMATPTPVPTAEPTCTTEPTITPEVTPTPVPTTAPAADPKAQILDFVNRIYTYVLDREPETEGAAFWTDELYKFSRTGAEVAQGFIFSQEFIDRNTTDEQFVTILYKTFFGREADEAGLKYWLEQLSSGTMDRVTVANGFIFSQEWADTCASYGIRSGGELKPTGKIEPTELTYAFVERMYTTAMGRDYDAEGRQYWAGELANFNITGEQVGAFFFLSEEMINYKLSDQEYLNRLYATFMNREADADGSAYWLGVMASGATRESVVYGFTRSPEFTEKCIEARILPFV